MREKDFPAPDVQNTAALILAGGRATRMGGVNKALVHFKGEPMIAQVIRTLKPQTAEILISANRDHEAFGALGAARIFADRLENYPGPLAAVEAAAAETEKDWLLMVPCDVPLIPSGLLDKFAEAFQKMPAGAYTVEADGRDQNTIALIHRSLCETVRPFVDRGDRKLGMWFDENGRVRVPWTMPGVVFANVNSKEELTALEKRQE